MSTGYLGLASVARQAAPWAAQLAVYMADKVSDADPKPNPLRPYNNGDLYCPQSLTKAAHDDASISSSCRFNHEGHPVASNSSTSSSTPWMSRLWVMKSTTPM